MYRQQPVSDPRQRQGLQHCSIRKKHFTHVIWLLPLMACLYTGCNDTATGSLAPKTSRTPSPLATVRGTPIEQAGRPVVAKSQDMQIATQVNTLFTSLVTQHQFSGTVLIAKDGHILLSQGYSMANWTTQTLNTPLTRFYLGSVTKEFTAMSILMLQEQGKLRVQSSICKYVIPCPSPWQSVTIHDVLTHTSGIPELDTSQLSGASPAAWIGSFDGYPLAFTPGSQFSYCSVCYQILAYVVEVVSGQSYAQFVQQAIFTPLQMKETGFDSNFFYAQPNDAHGYATWENEAEQLGWSVSPEWTFLFGSGLLYSSVSDLYLWDQALYTNKLVSEQTRDEAFTSYTSSSLFAGSTYGYGWFIAKSPVPGHRLIWHDGIIDGFRTYIGRYIDDDVTIIFLSNLATVDSPTLAQSVQKLVFAGT